MPISQARVTTWECPNCGNRASRLTWLAIDAIERPDLVEGIPGSLSSVCPDCLMPLQRTAPLFVLRLAKSAPLIAARAPDDDCDPIAELAEVVTAVRIELGATLQDVSGPTVVTTFDAIATGVTRGIDADFEALRAGRGEYDLEPAYLGLLKGIEVNQVRQQIEIGLEELAIVGSEDDLRDVVERRPEITTDEAEHRVGQHLDMAATEHQRRFAKSMLRTIRCIRQGDLSGAWSIRESHIREFWEDNVAARLREFGEATNGASPRALAQAGLQLLDVLHPGFDPGQRVEVGARTTEALLHDDGPDRDQSTERAIAVAQMVISILDANPEIDHPGHRIPVLMNLSVAYGKRLRGDPAWNRNRCMELLAEAIDRAWQAGDIDSWAMAQTNLAKALLDRGDADDVEQAREHLELALSHRSRERDPRDWAFTQLHLAMTYERAGSGDRIRNLRKAIYHSTSARDGSRSAGDGLLHGVSEHNLAAQRLRLSQVDGIALADRRRLLDRAEANAINSLRLIHVDASPFHFGHAWLIIAKVRIERNDQDGAIASLQTALTALSADTGPAEAREASRLLIELAEDRDNTELAADAAEKLVEAATTAISAHSRAEDRMSENAKGGTDFRFAAHALVCAGRLGKAVTSLEFGRARELDLLTWPESLDLELLSQLDPDLRAEIDRVGASFRADFLGSSGRSVSDRSEQFARIRTALRQVPTFEKALEPPTLDEIGMAAQPKRPLAYLGSARKGSYAIVMDRSKDGKVTLEAINAPDCDSQSIALLAMAGLYSDGTQVVSSAYLAAQSHAPEYLDSSIEALSPLLGEKLLRPLAEYLDSLDAYGVTIVPAGLLKLMPLHAVSWEVEGENRRILIDDFDVTFTPSARLGLACMQRVAQRNDDPIRLVGVANPLPHPNPLEGAKTELEVIEGLLPAGEHLVLKGGEATKERVLEALPSATHAHFACHGEGRFMEPTLSSALSLSDEEELTALEVASLEIQARLVVASACETGVVQGYKSIDEALGLATAFIAAGAAGVVSTLWEVDDLATALIVSKFYEGLLLEKISPTAALRRAQLWMRDADSDSIDAYASTRAPLCALLRAHMSLSAAYEPAPFGAPSFWAAFVFDGA